MLQLKPERLDAGEFDEQPISICGKTFVAHISGGLYWPAEEALIVADLHLEKGSAYANRGSLLPPYDTAETLSRLAAAIDHFEARTIIALGDSFHDTDGPNRLASQDLETLKILQDSVEWIWITGNHDPDLPSTLGGHIVDTLEVGGLTLRHQPRAGRVTHEISGHLHPAARLSMHGFSIRRPCFISNGLRIILPAFGTYAGGLNVMNEAFHPLFGNDGFCIWMLGQEGLYPIATRLLTPDNF